MVEEIGYAQGIYAQNSAKKVRKELGQFFTPPQIADYMTSLIDFDSLNNQRVNILDCGAGYGVLTASAALRLLKEPINHVHATLYELDDSLLSELDATMEKIFNIFRLSGKIFSYEIFHTDFVLERPDINNPLKYDISIINPPYFKYSVSTSPYSKAVSDLYKGDPNVYASFIAIMVAMLKEGAQAVIISPRSFLNGLYFKGFRNFILDQCSLKQLHIFKARNKVFADLKVLQENIIFKLKKGVPQGQSVIVSASTETRDLDNADTQEYQTHLIVDLSNDEKIIRIPESTEDYNTLLSAELLPSTFSGEGYFISTGTVVEHRTREFINSTINGEERLPLIKAHNVKLNSITWNGRHKKDYTFQLLEGHKKHLVLNTRYVILKRFTAKDEPKRLFAGIYNPMETPSNLVAITNKLNYIGRKNEPLTITEAQGLAAFFNSTFMDKYYRCISGNTQVNATDIRVMKFPSRETIITIGEAIERLQTLTQENIDQTINSITNL
jgi:adenine-specific DNA-methyltransferase